MEAIYEGIRSTPAEIVARAKEASAHVIGLSILSGSHLDLAQEVVRLLRAEGLDHIPVVVGGIVPPEDALVLKQMGVKRGLYAQGLPAHRHHGRHRQGGGNGGAGGGLTHSVGRTLTSPV